MTISPESINSGKYYLEAMMDLIQNSQVPSYVLQGPIDVPTQISALVGVFPSVRGKQPDLIGIDINPDSSSVGQSANRKILNLSIPDRVVNLNITGDPNTRAYNILYSAVNRVPSIVVAFGMTEGTEEEVVVLHCVDGYTPDLALRVLKKAVRQNRPV